MVEEITDLEDKKYFSTMLSAEDQRPTGENNDLIRRELDRQKVGENVTGLIGHLPCRPPGE